jgi:hypothetical protein
MLSVHDVGRDVGSETAVVEYEKFKETWGRKEAGSGVGDEGVQVEG